MFFFFAFSRDNETNGTVKYDIFIFKNIMRWFYLRSFSSLVLKQQTCVWEIGKTCRFRIQFNYFGIEFQLKIKYQNSHIFIFHKNLQVFIFTHVTSNA